MKKDIKIRISQNDNAGQLFKSIIFHPMESGYRRDRKTGMKISSDYIEDVQISVDGKIYFEIKLGENVSKNPYLSFVLSKPLVDDQLMNVSWVDNNKRKVSYDCIIKFNKTGLFDFNGTKKGSKIDQFLPEAGPICDLKK